MALIELENVTKIYRAGEVPVTALRGINLRIEAGEFVAVIGQSGSGKTTLLDILGCLSRPSSGSYRFEGKEMDDLSDEDLAAFRNRKIGFVFQIFHLLGRQTALQNVELPLFYAGVDRKERTRRAREALASVGLSERLAHTPAQLSGGQQQRVAIARALVNRPEVILADEPTGNLDSQSGREILELFHGLNRQGHTIILITHDRELAGQAHRGIGLRDGQVVSDGEGRLRGNTPTAVGR